MKNYCRQKDINYIENPNISKDCLRVKKLHLTQKGYSCFAKNVLKDLNNDWLGSDTVRHESVQKADFLAINETKLDKSFPTAQFNLLGFRTVSRKDITARSGGLLTCEMEIFQQKWYLSVMVVAVTFKSYPLKWISKNKSG